MNVTGILCFGSVLCCRYVEAQICKMARGEIFIAMFQPYKQDGVHR